MTKNGSANTSASALHLILVLCPNLISCPPLYAVRSLAFVGLIHSFLFPVPFSMLFLLVLLALHTVAGSKSR